MAKKDARERDPASSTPTNDDDRLDVPTLLWALGILAVLIILQRLIWGE
jgi:hypothetical protein